MEDSPQLQAVSGIAYYMSPPHNIKEVLLDPIHTVIYIALTVSTWTTVLVKIRDLPAAYYSTTRLAAHFQRCWFYFFIFENKRREAAG